MRVYGLLLLGFIAFVTVVSNVADESLEEPVIEHDIQEPSFSIDETTTFASVVEEKEIPNELAEDHALEEIANLQKSEEEEQALLDEQASLDSKVAQEAESAAKDAEAAAIKAEKEEKEAKQQTNEEVDWVRRSRPGAEAKPGANLKSAKTASEGKYDERKERDHVPDAADKKKDGAGGSYFGESEKEKELAAKKAEEAKKALETDRISSGAGDRRREVEGKLSPKVRARAANEAARRAQEEKEEAEWRLRATVSRRYARPVEKVIHAYGDEETSTTTPSMYAVLGVKRDADDDAIKRAYRIAALRIHPDKNPHPDSKAAFDRVQEAFNVLSSPLKRAQHDEELKKQSWIVSLTSLPKATRYVASVVDNVKSRALLLKRRVQDGEVQTEIEEVKGRFNSFAMRLKRKASHFSLLPTLADKISLLGEMIFDKSTLLGLGFIFLFFVL
eukprot:gene2151-4187_t